MDDNISRTVRYGSSIHQLTCEGFQFSDVTTECYCSFFANIQIHISYGIASTIIDQ